MKLTLYKLIERIREWCALHDQISVFGFGEQADMMQTKREDWFMFYISQVGPSVRDQGVVYNLEIFVVGLTDLNEDPGERDAGKIEHQKSIERTLSDTLQIIQDFFADVRYNKTDIFKLDGGYIKPDIDRIQPTQLIEDFEEMVTGWVFQIPIFVTDVLDACLAPLNVDPLPVLELQRNMATLRTFATVDDTAVILIDLLSPYLSVDSWRVKVTRVSDSLEIFNDSATGSGITSWATAFQEGDLAAGTLMIDSAQILWNWTDDEGFLVEVEVNELSASVNIRPELHLIEVFSNEGRSIDQYHEYENTGNLDIDLQAILINSKFQSNQIMSNDEDLLLAGEKMILAYDDMDFTGITCKLIGSDQSSFYGSGGNYMGTHYIAFGSNILEFCTVNMNGGGWPLTDATTSVNRKTPFKDNSPVLGASWEELAKSIC